MRQIKPLTFDELSESGYYWWLPECDLAHSDNPDYWTVISFHSANTDFKKRGLFVGPLPAPVFRQD